MLARIIGLLALLIASPVWAQSSLLQGGPWSPGHVPMYVGQGSTQPIVQDAGPASGGGAGVGASEFNLTIRGSGTGPFADTGTGPLDTNFCNYDAPTTNADGYHYLCFSPNAQGGGLIAYGAAGGASDLPLQIDINGTTYDFPSGLPSIGAHEVLSNITGSSAAAIGNTLSATIDAAIGSTQGNVLYRNATVWTVLAPGTNGQVLTSGGAAANLSWTSAGAGSVTSVAAGTGLSASPSPITGTGTLSLASITSHNLLSNITSGSAVPSDNTLTATIDAAIGSTQGSVLYRNASAWVPLSPGTSGQFLQTQGAAANPQWASSTGSPGGSNTQVQFNNSSTFGGSANLTWVSPALTIGVASSTTGQLKLTGSSSGTITIQGQAAAGTFNFNLPITAGTSGGPLLSAGGGSSPMTWGTVSGNTTVFGTISGSLVSGNCLKSDASGNIIDNGSTCGGGGGGSPGGSDTQVQFNNSGNFGGSANLTWVSPALTIGVAASTTGQLKLAGSTSGTTTVVPNNTASGTLTLPAATDTLIGKATTDTLTNKTFNTAGTGNVFQINGTGITAVTGTGSVVLATSPTLVTPTIGVATATSVNKVALTAPASAATLTIANNKTLTVSNSITIAGTDSTTMTFPTTNATISALNIEDQTLSGGANVTSKSQSTGNITVDCGARPLQYITNGGAFTITAPANDGSCILLVTNNGSAGAISFSGFSVGSNTGDALTTTNTNKFSIQVWRINGTSGYRIAAHQ